jgi:uncharacterized protein
MQISSKVITIFIYAVFFGFLNKSFAASFDCNQAKTPVEKTICNNEKISQLDEELAVIFKEAVKREAQTIKEQQRNWIKVRNSCKGENCVHEAYKNRISELNEFVRSFDKEMNYVARAKQEEQKNLDKTEFKPTDKDKRIIDYTHLANVCAGFYSRWSLNATSKNCGLSGDDNDLKCRAWASKDRLVGWYEYIAKKNNSNDMNVINYLKNTGSTTKSYRYGVDNPANNELSQQCYNYLYKK